jgi:pimeloyl-ACP methyl ester carboxylesterase
MNVQGHELEVFRGGDGDPILLLHGFRSFAPGSRFLKLLGAHGSVLAPTMPGFGGTKRPADFDSIYDLVHLTRAILDAVPGGKVTLIGLSFGGWIAAEVAAAGHHRLSRLVLVDPVGIKISDRQTADILDIFNRHPDEVRAAEYRDPDRFAPDFDAMEDEDIVRYARDRDALCLYGWNPYLYNPRLKGWLGRIAVPTLVAWGEHDGIVSPAYGRAFAGLIPGARFEIVPDAGHHPDVEQAEALAGLVGSFLGR